MTALMHPPTNDEIVAAIESCGEFSDEPTNQGWQSGRLCVACGEFEPDDADNSADGDRVVAVPSEHLVECSNGCGCYLHRECVDDLAAFCPHCNVLRDNLHVARAMVDFDPNMTMASAFGRIAAADRRSAGVPG